MRGSRLPTGGTNLFQAIKAKRTEAADRGIKIINLSIGQPSGPALLSARKAAAEAVMSDQESMHEYQDNGSPGVPDFARRFVECHVDRLDGYLEEDIAFLPIPGIKSMLGLGPLACGCAEHNLMVATTTNPGYPTPAVWCEYLGPRVEQYSVPLNPDNGFLLQTKDIQQGTALVMMNYAHNPSGQIATRKWLLQLCDFCERGNIRIFNDNPYYLLSHNSFSRTLAEVALDFEDLSWAEAFSASKVINNGTGWRVGAMVGSPDFIADIAKIKGNTDSGFAAPMAAGVLYAIKNDRKSIEECRRTYAWRIDLLTRILESYEMELAVRPGAGFFTLWKCPKVAFGEKIKDAEHFNFLMVERTGVVGVHFDPYIRYAVTSDIEAMASEIEEAFKKAAVSY